MIFEVSLEISESSNLVLLQEWFNYTEFFCISIYISEASYQFPQKFYWDFDRIMLNLCWNGKTDILTIWSLHGKFLHLFMSLISLSNVLYFPSERLCTF